jgi:hypothetical protein
MHEWKKQRIEGSTREKREEEIYVLGGTSQKLDLS